MRKILGLLALLLLASAMLVSAAAADKTVVYLQDGATSTATITK